jgi:hypothetical protein
MFVTMPALHISSHSSLILFVGTGGRGDKKTDASPTGMVSLKSTQHSDVRSSPCLPHLSDILADIVTTFCADNDGQLLIFRDWKGAPLDVASTGSTKLLDPGFSEVVECDEHIQRILTFAESASQDGRPGRYPCLLTTASSGAGKSALLQAVADKAIPQDICVLPITFNRHEPDPGGLPAANGLALRIAERFLCADGSNFDRFRQLWIKHGLSAPHKNASVVRVVEHILQLVKNIPLLILIDEPGLAWFSDREGLGSDLKAARAVLTATTELRQDARFSRVRIVLTSLAPLWADEKALVKELNSGLPIEWLIFRPAGSVDAKAVRELLINKLSKKVPLKHRQRAVDYVLAISNGHWSTISAMIASINFKTDRLPVARHRTVIDCVVSVDKGLPLGDWKPGFSKVLAQTALGRSIPATPLLDLAYRRVILNSIVASDSKFSDIVPLVSLLAVREWVLHNDSLFARDVQRVLQAAGHDFSDVGALEEDSPLAFEGVVAHFFLMKLHAISLLGLTRVTLLPKSACQGTSLLCGHSLVFGEAETLIVSPPEIKMRMLTETQCFHAASLCKKNASESDDDFFSRRSAIAHATALCFEDGEGKLRAGHYVRPGAKNQPYADGLLVLRLREVDAKTSASTIDGSPEGAGTSGGGGTVALIFIQNKFSEDGSATTTAPKDVEDALSKLLRDRGVLFNSPEATIPVDSSNQIAQLGVAEKDVILCFTSLRKRVSEMAWLRDAALRANFQGRIAMTDGKAGCRVFFGPSFKRLALLGTDDA